MQIWDQGGWASDRLRFLPEGWHRMSSRERRSELGHDRVAPPAPEIGADGGYKVPPEFAEAFLALLRY